MDIIYDNPNEDIIERLLKIRQIDNFDSFLNPSFSNSWIDPYKLNDFEKAINRIQKAISNNEKIIIFGDYDVDGITASYLLYIFISKFLNYKKISIRLPNRLTDGYGIKDFHLDQIKELGVNLVITVDNGITSIKEAEYAKSIGLDLIITDHHKALNKIPPADAVVNPQISPNYQFKGIAGVGVAFKIVSVLMSKYFKKNSTKQKIIQYLMPIVAIGTVSDCVPLLEENRLFVKMGLNYINNGYQIPSSLTNFLKYLNINQQVNTFHIGFMLGPRLNAGGRMQSPYDSLNCLLFSGDKQLQHLDSLEKLNNERRQTQENVLKKAEQIIEKDKKILFAASEELHEGIVGIVAGRITEKYNKPSAIFNIKQDEGVAVASLRGPEYFSVIDMLNYVGEYLERYGGHKQAGGLTVKLENLEKVQKLLEEYSNNTIKEEDLKKPIKIDTPIYQNEINKEKLSQIDSFAPFGEGNPEPIFLINQIVFNNIEKVGKNGNGHLKAYASMNGTNFPVLFWGKGENLDFLQTQKPTDLIGKVKKDNYNGGFFIDGIDKVD
ncbi:single-stranded-DNA-specific exonuclease RecJ [Candidatus Absconditicoccus praedator]|uniref:single-stranded-DNA-specific exonuclease RecJ n=1 Tax=Candidatus Absconditicoccus praedator TaxID=2735562 RepID=UPI001E63AE8C|nr:single-stranded-DNA-specific exonuclease RecJ [Candidatus Absconditicoccus praedator]UFX83157.1 single-stranded-DNA-specific exonuclease RecJ [Candidatus Absconditicoccus praedator]